ncbi:NUDIX domain-containing protein [Peribacillus sp. SCS-37]|uniref:NUDIX domain-containing protein n=1 Tax=Paraperibacillus esterisolvens TaxID=3115296 RepID=UPI0039057A5C
MSFHIRVRAGALIIKEEKILLIEFRDENGLHYNLPAGGAEPGESIREAVRREAMEEACVDVGVGELAFIYEYAPHECGYRFGNTHSLGLMFECELAPGSAARMPDRPDANQTGVKWVALSDLTGIILYPNLADHILDFASGRKTLPLIEENALEEYI